MTSFKQRSDKKELLDGLNIPFEDIKRNMQELDTINTLLGGHKITIAGIKKIIEKASLKNKISIVEIGCGGGDNLRAIKKWAFKNKIEVALTGIDINEECIAYARSASKNSDIKFLHSDFKEVKFDSKPHIIFSSLFCHHFSDDELVQMLQWQKNNAQAGFFINDLHRHSLAYYSIKITTHLLSKSYLVKNDAPLSVQRGFVKKEWQNIFNQAGIKNIEIEWKWAFRWLIIALIK